MNLRLVLSKVGGNAKLVALCRKRHVSTQNETRKRFPRKGGGTIDRIYGASDTESPAASTRHIDCCARVTLAIPDERVPYESAMLSL